jgi:hypothetical protein
MSVQPNRAGSGAKVVLRRAFGRGGQTPRKRRAASFAAAVQWSPGNDPGPRADTLLKALEAENEELRRQAVELALEIQELRARRRS